MTVVFILGMGRSGTSALTRVLSLCGAALPDSLLGAQQSNRRGHWEPVHALKLNDEFLFRHGSSWWDPSLRLQAEAEFEPRERDTYLEEIEAFVATCPKAPILVIKEPRITALSDFWFAAARRHGFSVRAVVALRHPDEVIASLAKRDGTSLDLGAALWLKYNLLAERHSRPMPRVFVEYTNLLSNWRTEVSRIEKALSIELTNCDDAAINEFLTQDLQHHQTSGQIAQAFGQPWMSQVYKVLSAAALDRPLNQKVLDRVFDSYRACERAFRISRNDFHARLTSGPTADSNARIVSMLLRSAARPNSDKLQSSLRGEWYLRQNQDLFEAKVDPYEHWVLTGAEEGRLPSSDPIGLLEELVREREQIVQQQGQEEVRAELQQKFEGAQLQQLLEQNIALQNEVALVRRETSERTESHLLELAEHGKAVATQLLQQQECLRALQAQLSDAVDRGVAALAAQSAENNLLLRDEVWNLQERLRQMETRAQEAIHQSVAQLQRHDGRLDALAPQFLAQQETFRAQQAELADVIHHKIAGLAAQSSERDFLLRQEIQRLQEHLVGQRHDDATRERRLQDGIEDLRKRLEHAELHFRQTFEQDQKETWERFERILTEDRALVRAQYSSVLMGVKTDLERFQRSRSWRWSAPIRGLAGAFGREEPLPAVRGIAPATGVLSDLLDCQDHLFIRRAYWILLGREPDPRGLENYLQVLRAGVSKLSILKEMAKSPEGEARGATPLGPMIDDIGGTWHQLSEERGTAFLSCAYQALFGRDLDADGQNTYCSQLRKGASRAEILAQLLDSDEYRARWQGRTKSDLARRIELEVRRWHLSRLRFIGPLLKVLLHLRVTARKTGAFGASNSSFSNQFKDTPPR